MLSVWIAAVFVSAKTPTISDALLVLRLALEMSSICSKVLLVKNANQLFSLVTDITAIDTQCF